MISLDLIGYGPLQGLPTFFNSTALGTTPAKVTLPTLPGSYVGPRPQFAVKVRIYNGSSTATIAWSVVARAVDGTSVAPTITAAFAATAACPIGPLGEQVFAIPADKDLYVVASAAATSVNVTSFLFS